MHKADVIRLGESLGVPFELTLSCMQPVNGLHCGRCSKCRERRDAFVEAGVEDPTDYCGEADQVTGRRTCRNAKPRDRPQHGACRGVRGEASASASESEPRERACNGFPRVERVGGPAESELPV